MGSAVSLKTSADSRDPRQGLPSSQRGSAHDALRSPSLPRTHVSSSRGTAVSRAGDADESPQMMPLTQRNSSSVSSIPSSLSSLEHASPMVTPSPGRATTMDGGASRAHALRGNSMRRPGGEGGGDLTRAGSGATRSTQQHRESTGCRPWSSTSSVTSTTQRTGGRAAANVVPEVEEMAVMAAALMKPYHTMCSKLDRSRKSMGRYPSSRLSSPSLAACAVARLPRVEEREEEDEDEGEPAGMRNVRAGETTDGGSGGVFQLRTEPWTASPCMQTFLFTNPPPEVSELVAATYPARWLPSITACFDEGLLYRIEWRRHGHRRLPGETEDYANVVWCFHNSTACYAMEVEVTFEVPPECRSETPLRGWGDTTVAWAEDEAGAASSQQKGPKAAELGKGTAAMHRNLLKARTICPPLSTVGFVLGRAGAFQTSIRGVPVPADASEPVLSTSASETQLDERLQSLSSEEALRLALKEWRRFVDPEFPPNDASLQGKGYVQDASLTTLEDAAAPAAATTDPDRRSPAPSSSGVRWLRTSDIVARLVGPSCVPLTRMHQPLVPIIDPIYIDPGELGDSWLIGAMAAVAEHPTILLRMFRHPASTENAKIERVIGAFRVTLNVQGWWRSVVVDDFLPVTGGHYPKYAHSRRDVRELWMGLLEKAFAKVRGGYANITAGDPLDALHVLTGWPCARYDIANFKDIAVASSAFASRLLRYDRHGLQIIFHTAPATAGDTDEDDRGDLEEGGGGRGNGLAPGMVYTVLQILQFSTNPFRAELTLLQVRNIWGDVAAWRGRWRCGSPRWAQWPRVAEACRMPPHPRHAPTDGERRESTKGSAGQRTGAASSTPSTAECTCRREKFIWLEWNEVYRYFSGCGVMFRLALHHDYRVQGVFDGVHPSVCLRVTVTTRSFVGITLSMQKAHEEQSVDAEREAGSSAGSTYPPIMVSLAREQANVLYIVRNSQMDPDNPTPLFTFMQVSDASLLSLLTPEDSPYWVIPRMLATASSPAASTTSGDASPPPAAVQHPYVLGFFQKDPAGTLEGPRVEFVQLPPTSPAFQNSIRFSLGTDARPVRAKFQAKAPQAGFPKTYIHTEVSEEAGTPADDDFNFAAAGI